MNLELIPFLELIFSLSDAAYRFRLAMMIFVLTKNSGKRSCETTRKDLNIVIIRRVFLKRGRGVFLLHCDDNDDADGDEDDDDQG